MDSLSRRFPRHGQSKRVAAELFHDLRQSRGQRLDAEVDGCELAFGKVCQTGAIWSEVKMKGSKKCGALIRKPLEINGIYFEWVMKTGRSANERK